MVYSEPKISTFTGLAAVRHSECNYFIDTNHLPVLYKLFFFFSLNLSIYNPIYKRRHLEKALNEGITVSHNGVSNKVGAVEAAASLYCELHKQHLSKQLQ